tara:strand:- start:972 stop:1838 length:867 start_codon:yes stop_codon:yes gene_type:complete
MNETGAPAWRRLGVIAGGGRLPVLLASAESQADRAPFVIRLNGFADQDYANWEGQEFNLGAVGSIQNALKNAGCDAVCFSGNVKRPDIRTLAPADLTAARLLPKAIAAGMKGDDALLRVVLEAFESAGFTVVGADNVLAGLIPSAGVFGDHQPSGRDLTDAHKALAIARAIGGLDIGQGAVVCDGLVLAVEAQEGTDAMLQRVANLPGEIRGAPGQRRGVLGKAPKPIQERRMDLPVIGVSTVRNAARAGMSGIAVEAGGALVVDRQAVINAANEDGLFVTAINPNDQ